MTLATSFQRTSGEAAMKALGGPEKAAVLFLCLGEDRGTDLMKRLSEDEIRKISHAMAGLGIVPAPVVEEVMVDFGRTVAHGGSVVGSFSMAESMLRKVLPDDQVTAILREIRGPLQERDLWARFSMLNETSIAGYLKSEHDQTAAAILSNVEPKTAAAVLPLLGEERMISIIERMVALDAVPQHMMKQIEEGAAANLERAKRERVEGEGAAKEAPKKKITLGDISKLAESASELPPARSIFEQAREEKEAEIKAKAEAAEVEDEDEKKEPTGEFASTISALDRLTAAIDEKLGTAEENKRK